ncbi:MAG TPA: hypothetical protein VF559_03355 [Caulobacteraceae bacterium]|jgi:hypothetical protein
MSDYEPGTSYHPGTPEVRDRAAASADAQPAEPARGLAEPPRKGTRNLAPLVWIILLALAALAAFAVFQARGNMKTPTGGDMPMATPLEQPVMPKTDAPAVTGGDQQGNAEALPGGASGASVDGAGQPVPVPPEANRG